MHRTCKIFHAFIASESIQKALLWTHFRFVLPCSLIDSASSSSRYYQRLSQNLPLLISLPGSNPRIYKPRYGIAKYSLSELNASEHFLNIPKTILTTNKNIINILKNNKHLDCRSIALPITNIKQIKLTQDEKKAVVISDENTLFLIDLETSACSDLIQLNSPSISGLTKDGKRVYLFWKNKSQTQFHYGELHLETKAITVTNSYPCNDRVEITFLDQRGSFYLSNVIDNTMHLIDCDTRRVINIPIIDFEILHASLTPDGTKVALIGRDTSLSQVLALWDLTKKECLKKITIDPYRVDLLLLSPDGTKAILRHSPNAFLLWDLIQGECLGLYYQIGLSGNKEDYHFTEDGIGIFIVSKPYQLYSVFYNFYPSTEEIFGAKIDKPDLQSIKKWPQNLAADIFFLSEESKQPLQEILALYSALETLPKIKATLEKMKKEPNFKNRLLNDIKESISQLHQEIQQTIYEQLYHIEMANGTIAQGTVLPNQSSLFDDQALPIGDKINAVSQALSIYKIREKESMRSANLGVLKRILKSLKLVKNLGHNKCSEPLKLLCSLPAKIKQLVEDNFSTCHRTKYPLLYKKRDTRYSIWDTSVPIEDKIQAISLTIKSLEPQRKRPRSEQKDD